MKGIKECLSWMFENENKWIVNENETLLKFVSGEFHTSGVNSEIVSVGLHHIQFIDNYEWKEFIEPVDFLTAYKDCLENGTRYRGVNVPQQCNRSQLMQKYLNIVDIVDEYSSSTIHLCEFWIKES